jgi:phosphoenolpyruvate carboxylase
MRKIPGTMATQHPDNAAAPYWVKDGSPFVGAYQEIGEAVACFDDLNVSEYMWDWEGKHADAAVIDRLFSEYYDYFSKNKLGKDRFLTFRIPNVWEEKGYNLLQAMSVILSGEDFARDLKFSNSPLFEVILPMTESADQLMHMHKLFEKLSHFKSTDFTSDQPANNDYLELIPLIESVGSQLAVVDLLNKYVALHQKHFSKKPRYIRAFLACSDSALSSGFLAASLGNKVALARLYEFQASSGIKVYPVAGCGSLPFRGGLSPSTVDRFLSELAGMRTVTLQSSFRYDHPIKEVKSAIAKLEKNLPKTKPLKISLNDQKLLESVINKAAKFYQLSIEKLAGDMQPVFAAFPKRRDRRQHIGLVAYGRNMNGQSLPRAITFTGAFYSMGVPPEFIGLGRALDQLSSSELQVLKDSYKHLRQDLTVAGRYLNRTNLETLASRNKAWKMVEEDIRLTEQILDLHFEPKTADERAHQKISTAALHLLEEPDTLRELINKMGGLRKSLG